MADVPVTDLIKRWEALNSGRGTWLNHWEDLARLMLPRRMGFTSSHVNGDRRTDDQYDGTPMQAARGLANALGGFMRPEGEPIARLKAEGDDIDIDDQANAWLADSQDRLQTALQNPKARFRQATGECDLDLVVFGTGVIFASENLSRRNLLFQSVHLKDACVFYNDEGEAEGVFRMRMFTLRQAIDRFGEEKLSDVTKQKLSANRTAALDGTVKILHAVYPRKDAQPGALLARNLPWADIWAEVDAKHTIQTKGFHEFPFIVPRWDTSSGEDYGRSPGMIALPDAATLQAMGETMLVAGQRVADPPLMAPNDGSFSEANTFPGGITYYDVETAAQLRGNPFFPLETGANLPITRDMQTDTRDQVMNAFFKNILNLPVEGPAMTATEINQRKEEFIREIGPVFGRLESDYTAPMVNRSFSIMLRTPNALLPIPESLQGRNVRFEYESPIKKIKKQVEAAAARMWVQEHILAAKETGRPDILDTVNFDSYSRFSAEAAGIPNSIVNGTDAVAAIRQQRAQAQQQAQEAAQAQQEAMMAKDVAGAAKDAGMVDQPAKAA